MNIGDRISLTGEVIGINELKNTYTVQIFTQHITSDPVIEVPSHMIKKCNCDGNKNSPKTQPDREER